MMVSLFRRGYCLHHNRATHKKSGGGKRGSLTGKLSSASFRRLRAWCIEHDIDSDAWGITLTVPALDLMAVSEFKSLHHKLCVFCNDNKFPLVWRVELQRRGQPHLHCVLFGSNKDALLIACEWFRLLSSQKVYNVEKIGSEDDLVFLSRAFVNGSNHAFDIQRLSGDFRAWRYLVSHMSKSKRAQLGWAGRNWGVCNRAKFDLVNNEYLFTTHKEFYYIRRVVRRFVSGAKPFPLLSTGKTYTKRRFATKGKVYFLGDPAVIRRVFLYRHSFVDDPTPANHYSSSYWLFSWFGLQFLVSVPQGYFDLVEICTRYDCLTIKDELYSMALQFWLWYDDVPF